MKEKCIEYWNKFTNYKETAEQYEFPTILMLDSYLTPRYNKLMKNFNDESANKFMEGMKIIFDNFGIEYDQLCNLYRWLMQG